MATGIRGLLKGNSAASYNAVCFVTGKLLQTTHHLPTSPPQVTITRRHHPLVEQNFKVWRASKVMLVIIMTDGSRQKIPRKWTDADGPGPRSALEGNTPFTVEGLRDLLGLLAQLRVRL